MPVMIDVGPCFFCPDLPQPGGRGDLEEDETRHASAARRLRAGDTIGLIDGKGGRATAVVESVARGRLAFSLHERRHVPPPDPSLVLACAVPKGERFRTLIDMLSQIGVAGIVPLACERGTVRPRVASVRRWRRIAVEACKQSRNPWLPVIHAPSTVEESLAAAVGNVLAFADAGGRPATEVLPGSGTLHLYIGPEGGFTAGERDMLREHGARPLHLGGNILRTETAALVAAARCLTPG